MVKVYFVGGQEAFVEKDRRIIAERHELVDNSFDADVLFCWFANAKAAYELWLNNRRARIPSVVVAGGYECACVPEIGYGWRGTWRGRISRYALQAADVVLSVSEYNKNEVLSFATPKDLRVVPHGFSSEGFDPKEDKSDGIVLSVGAVKPANWHRKGITYYLTTARELPDHPFHHAGHIEKGMRKFLDRTPKNTHIHGRLPPTALQNLMNRSATYVQPSWHEAFGCSVAEAMLAGCTPVISDKGALPEVVAGQGVIIGDHTNPKSIAAAIKQAEAIAPNLQPAEHIQKNYPLDRRRKALHTIIEEATKK